MPAIVLTYHSHNISGRDYRSNDHVALAADLETIHGAGATIVPLSTIAGKLADGSLAEEASTLVGISFDDGPVFDFEDFVHPMHGEQRSFLNILRDFAARHPGAQPTLHATSFVIASPEARRGIERSEQSGYSYLADWLGDRWWRDAASTNLVEIGNHSWDHVHSAAPSMAAKVSSRNNFGLVKDHAAADAEIRAATDFIDEKVPGPCRLFAYPFGHTNSYLVGRYFPERQAEHRMVAAFSTDGRAVRPGDSRWKIPRLVCGQHWRRGEELARLLARGDASWATWWRRVAGPARA